MTVETIVTNEMTQAAVFVPTLLNIAILIAVTTAVLWGSGVPHHFAPALAILRGAAPLAVISFVLGGVITSPLWVGAALLVMFTIAVVTATCRIRWSWSRFTLDRVIAADVTLDGVPDGFLAGRT